MTSVTPHVVDAFIDVDQGGNPAGVVLDADRLSQHQKQHLAQQIGLSETAFDRGQAWPLAHWHTFCMHKDWQQALRRRSSKAG